MKVLVTLRENLECQTKHLDDLIAKDLKSGDGMKALANKARALALRDVIKAVDAAIRAAGVPVKEVGK